MTFVEAFGSVALTGTLSFLIARFFASVDAAAAAFFVGAGLFVGRGYGEGQSAADLPAALGGIAALALIWWFWRNRTKIHTYG